MQLFVISNLKNTTLITVYQKPQPKSAVSVIFFHNFTHVNITA